MADEALIWCRHGRFGRAHPWEPGEACPPTPVLPETLTTPGSPRQGE